MLKRIVILSLAMIMLAWPLQAAEWNIDKAHSSIGFSVRHLVISSVKGSFIDYTDTVKFDGKNLADGSVEVTIKVASINTENEDRDNHLRGSEFFNVAEYPTMTFKSKKIIPGADNEFKMIGDLTMKDVTKEITLDGKFNGTIDDPWGNTRAGFSAETTINRQDFNVSWENKLKDGSLVVGNEVTILLDVELVKQK